MFKNECFDLKSHFLSQANLIAYLDEQLTYGQWLQEINYLIEWFKGKKIIKNQEVVLCMSNSHQIISALIALWTLEAHPILIPQQMPHSFTNVLYDLPRGQKNHSHNLNFPLKRKAVTIFTSGTTDHAKGVILTIGNLLQSALGVNEYFGLNSSHSWKIVLPMSRIGGFIIPIRTMLAGASFTFHEKATHLSIVPKQLLTLSDDCKSADAILVGGGPMLNSLLQKYSSLPIYQSYGMTEIASTIAIKYKDSVTILSKNEIKINKQGLLMIKGPSRFHSYSNGKKPFDKDGFFTTSDLAKFDQGNLQILGRSDTQFISGGINIDPQFIEASLMQIEGISKAIVLPKSDPELGEIPIAFINSKDITSQENIIEQLKKTVHPYHVPKKFYPIDGRSITELKKSIL